MSTLCHVRSTRTEPLVHSEMSKLNLKGSFQVKVDEDLVQISVLRTG